LANLAVCGIGLLGALCVVVPMGAAQSPQAAGGTTQQAQTAQAPNPGVSAAAKPTPPGQQRTLEGLEETIKRIIASGRIQQIGESSSARLSPTPRLTPGAPPILAFRYFDGQSRHRFGDLDLVMDDAGH
jgi:hypothetical protein